MFRARWLWFALALSAPSAVRGDAFNLQNLPMGQRSLGMGGAAVALGTDPSTSFYNPAGVALVKDTSLSASLTLTAFDRRVIKRGYRRAEGSTDLRHESKPSVPLFVAAVKKLGSRGRDRIRRHAVAFSSFTAMRRTLSLRGTILSEGAGGRVDSDYRIEREYRSAWHGLSYAFRVSPRLALGLSAFFTLTRLRHGEDLIIVDVSQQDPATGRWGSGALVTERSYLDLDFRHLVFRVGAWWQPTPTWRAGVMLQPQAIEWTHRARIETLQADTTSGDGTVYRRADESGLAARAPLPWELRLGVAHLATEWLTIAVDASLHSGVGSASAPVQRVQTPAPDPISGERPPLPALLAQTYHTRWIANWAVGGEAIIGDVAVARAGFFTNLSAAPKVPARADAYTPPFVNRYGLTASLGLLSKDYNLSIGLLAVLGRGEALGRVDVPGEPAFMRTSVRDRTLYLFFSGYREAARKLADETLDRLNGRLD